MTKQCTKCEVEKEFGLFSKNRTRKDGLQHTCKSCAVEARLDWKKRNPKKYQEGYRKSNELRDSKIVRWDGSCTSCGVVGSELFRKNRRKCIECRRAYMKGVSKKYYHSHIDEVKAYREANRDRIAEAARVYSNRKYRTDLQYRLRLILRTRLNRAVEIDQKAGSAVRDLGCSIGEFKLHLEAQFRDGMTWENQGLVWEIDHIVPISHFDLTNRMEFLVACNYINMQPLLVEENRKKGNKVNV